MSDRIGGIVEVVRLRLEEELRQQLTALTAEHEQALEAALATAARTAEQETQALEERHAAELGAARTSSEQAIAAAVAAARVDFDRERELERQASGEVTRTLKNSITALESCRSLTDVLNLSARLADKPGGGLFVALQGSLTPWSAEGPVTGKEPDGFAAAAWRDRRSRSDAGRTAVPLMLDGSPVGVLVGPAADEIQLDLLGAAIASRLAAVTAARFVQAHRWSGGATASDPTVSSGPASQPVAGDDDPSASARRYARLLISEIQLYNEDAVREGRQQRDLRTRLGSEIDRARQIYETRVPADLPGRSVFFHEELVRTLANGDASLFA